MKLGQYVIMLVVFAMFLEFCGITTGIGSTLSYLGININSSHQLQNIDIESSGMWSYVFGASGILVVLAGGGAVIIGLFAKSYDTSLIILPAIIVTAGLFVGLFWSTMIVIINLGETWLTSAVSIVIAALAVGFLFSCMDYFAGR